MDRLICIIILSILAGFMAMTGVKVMQQGEYTDAAICLVIVGILVLAAKIIFKWNKEK